MENILKTRWEPLTKHQKVSQGLPGNVSFVETFQKHVPKMFQEARLLSNKTFLKKILTNCELDLINL